MILKIYALYDRIAQEFPFTFKAKNDDMMKRVCMSAMLDQGDNIIKNDTDDKDIYITGEFDTETGVVKGLERPGFILHLAEVRTELLAKIRESRQAAGEPVDEETKDEK